MVVDIKVCRVPECVLCVVCVRRIVCRVDGDAEQKLRVVYREEREEQGVKAARSARGAARLLGALAHLPPLPLKAALALLLPFSTHGW